MNIRECGWVGLVHAECSSGAACSYPDGDGPYCIGDAAGGVWDGATPAKYVLLSGRSR